MKDPHHSEHVHAAQQTSHAQIDRVTNQADRRKQDQIKTYRCQRIKYNEDHLIAVTPSLLLLQPETQHQLNREKESQRGNHKPEAFKRRQCQCSDNKQRVSRV